MTALSAPPLARVARALVRLRSVASRPVGYAVLVVLAAVTLALGSVHRSAPTAAQRIASLEAVIKCPSCTDESIAQSDASTAVGLRRQVAAEVHEGWTNAAILARVQQEEGNDLLVPTGHGAWIAWGVPLAVVALGAGFVLVVVFRRRSAPVARPEDDELLAAARREEAGSR